MKQKISNQDRAQLEYYNKPWVAGGGDTIDLPLSTDLESVYIYVSGSINVTTAFAGIKTEGLAKLIDKVEIWSKGRQIAVVPFTYAVFGNFARQNAPVSTKPGIAVGNYVGVEAGGYVDLSAIKCIRPKDSNLAAHGNNGTLQLKFRYNQLTDMFINGAVPGAATASLSTIVVLDTCKEDAHSALPTLLHVHQFDEKIYTANTVDNIRLNPEALLRSIVFRQEVNGDLSNAVINRVTMAVNGEQRANMLQVVLYDKNISDNNGVALQPGYLVLDFARNPGGLCKVTDFLDLYGTSDIVLTLDVNGGATNKVQYIQHRFERLDAHVALNAKLKADLAAAGMKR